MAKFDFLAPIHLKIKPPRKFHQEYHSGSGAHVSKPKRIRTRSAKRIWLERDSNE